MAKIIKLPPVPEPHRANCTKCLAVIEFYKTDGTYVSYLLDGDYWNCICPNCRKIVSIPAFAVPTW